MLLQEGSLVRRWVETWVRVSVRHPWLSAAVWLALTALALWVASGLALKTDLAALLPRTYKSVEQLDRIKEKVGGLERVVFVVESPDSAANHRFAVAIGQAMERRADVSFVEWTRDLSFFEDRKLLYMDYADLVEVYRRVSSRAQMDLFSEPLDFSDIERKYENRDTQKRDEWGTEDGTMRLVMAYPEAQSADMGKARWLIAMASTVVDSLRSVMLQRGPTYMHPDTKVYIGGDYKNRVVEYDVILGDIKSTAAIAVLGIILLISTYFRQYFAALFIGYPLIVGLSWTFAITELVIGNLNLITGFLIAVLAGLGIDFGIHIFSRYIEERDSGHDLEEAIRRAVVNTGAALSTSATTTVAAFYSLTITDFKGFSEFGFIAGTGVGMTLIAILLTFPAFVTVGERLHLVRHRRGVKKRRESSRALLYARPVLLTFAVLLVLAAVSAAIYPGMRFEWDFANLRANEPTLNEIKAKIGRVQSMDSPPAAVVVEDSAARQAVKARILQIKASDPATTIKEVRSVSSFLPQDQEKKMRLIKRLRRVVQGREQTLLQGQSEIRQDELDRWVSVEPVSVSDLPGYITRKFRGPDGSLGQFVMIGTTAQLRDGKQAVAFANEVRKIDTEKHGVFYASGTAIIFADMLIVMEHDSVIAISITLLVVLAIVLFDFGSLRTSLIVWVPVILGIGGLKAAEYLGINSEAFNILEASELVAALALVLVIAVFLVDRKSFRDAAIVMSPLIGGIVLLLGTMAVFDVKLDFYNMVVLPSIIGMGIDNGVHLYHRYLEEGPGKLRYVMRTTGGAVLMASLTTMVGFSGMVTAKHQGLNSMGDVAIIGMLSTLLMSVVFLPMLLTYRERRSGHPQDQSAGPESREKTAAMASEVEG